MLTDTRVRRGSFAVLYRVVALVPRAFRSTQLSTRAGVATTVSNVYKVGMKSHACSGTCSGTVVHCMLGSRVGSTTAYVLYTVPAQAGMKSHACSGTCSGTVVHGHGMLGPRVDSTTAYVLYTVPAQAVFLGLHRSFDIHTAGMGEPHRLRQGLLG